jgi:hypothetical protein
MWEGVLLVVGERLKLLVYNMCVPYYQNESQLANAIRKLL